VVLDSCGASDFVHDISLAGISALRETCDCQSKACGLGSWGPANMSEIAMLRQTFDTAFSSPRFVLTNGSIYAGVQQSEALNRVAPDNVAVDDFVYV